MLEWASNGVTVAAFAAIALWWHMEDLKRLVRKSVQREVLFISERQMNRFRFFLPFLWALLLLPATFGLVRLAVWWSEAGTPELVIVLLFSVFNVIIWGRESVRWYRYWKESDDDFWRKKREKALDKVKELAGKLVVVPQPVPVPIRA